MILKGKTIIIGSLCLSVLFFGCATYYKQNIAFHNLLETGRLPEAQKYLEKNNKPADGVNRVLYNLNLGTTAYLNQDYQKSIDAFKSADLYHEDFSNQLGYEALALISNPMVKPYRLEYFEAVMIHYYQALNFIALQDYEGALVECRRVNLQLQRINDQFKNHNNKYARDAFAHNLMGIIYEATGDYNNAFIAYRNAVEVYENDYKMLYGLDVPLQLKKDVIRSAVMTGFLDQVDFFERKFNIKYEPLPADNGQLVCFWMNGLGPVKSEWSINFVNTGYNNGWITLANEETGMSFPFFIGNKSSDEKHALANLRALRIAFPRYTERRPKYSQALLQVNQQSIPLELAQNVNAIAFQSLNDRMWREIGNSLLRLATKKALEELASSKNQELGAVISLVNAFTEKADTRNWQSLPYAISYGRFALPEGEHGVAILPDGNTANAVDQSITIKKGRTSFLSFHQF